MTDDLFTITAPTQPDAVRRRPQHIERAERVVGCSTKRTGPPQTQCSFGDGDGPYSADSGRTNFCGANHAPPGFYDYRKRA